MTRQRLILAAIGIPLIVAVTAAVVVREITTSQVLAQLHRNAYNAALALRVGCLRTSERTVILANIFRADEEGNAAVAADPAQPSRTRQARQHEAELERRSLVALDHGLDPRAISGLNPIGRRIVKSFGAATFSCDRAYPLPKS